MRGLAVLLLAAAAWSAEWKLGEPAPERLAVTEGRITVVVTGGEIEGGAKALASCGADLVSREGGDAKAYLVDERGVVRRLGRAPATATELATFVAKWEDGRAVFRNRCARCHGEDGMDTGYPYIRQLGGIGKRLTEEEIRESLHPAMVGPDHILVRGEPYSKKELEAVVIYVRGL